MGQLLSKNLLATKIVPLLYQSQLESLIQWLDKHLAGRRFDWNNFLVDYFPQIEGLKPESAVKPTQVNILTCLEKWGKENQSIIPLYELFCDLVHPNLGSTFLITRILDDRLVVGGERGKPLGQEIFQQTFGKLLKLFR